jgi:hypothetical protein
MKTEPHTLATYTTPLWNKNLKIYYTQRSHFPPLAGARGWTCIHRAGKPLPLVMVFQ